MTATIAPVETRLTVLPEWVDYNGHMNVAYYVLAFDRATDTLYDALRIGGGYVAQRQHSLFTLSMNVDYLREVFAGDEILITSRMLDHDHKRVHYFHEMHHAGEGWLAATNECVAIHVDMAQRRSAPFDDAAAARLAEMKAAHAALGRPDRAGRTLSITRERPRSADA
jgi:acyl-CoA thioester hydrolase